MPLHFKRYDTFITIDSTVFLNATTVGLIEKLQLNAVCPSSKLIKTYFALQYDAHRHAISTNFDGET